MDQGPIWKKPEGMTFEDVEELKPGEVGIVAVPFEPADRVTLFALLKDPAKNRAGRP